MPNGVPAISAVVIARNEQLTIRRCIESVLAQSVPVEEIIVVDGNSTDHTARYVSDFARKHGHIRLVVENPGAVERGPAAARNLGAGLASGELILFLNGDVTIGPDYVSKLLSEMSDRGLDAVAGLRWNVRSSLVSGLMNVHYALNYNSLPQTLDAPVFLSGDALLLRAENFWGVGGYDPAMPAGEDADLGYRLRGTGSKIGYRADATIWHQGQHYRSFADWVRQVEWYGRGAAALARAHEWRMSRERAGLRKHVLMPLAGVLAFLLIVIVAASVFGPLALVAGAIGTTVVGVKYLRTAALVQRRCSNVSLPTRPLPQDVLLYPFFRFARYGLLSMFTWRALMITDENERRQRTEDGAV